MNNQDIYLEYIGRCAYQILSHMDKHQMDPKILEKLLGDTEHKHNATANNRLNEFKSIEKFDVYNLSTLTIH